MTQREKLLAAAVGLMALMIVLFYSVTSISDAFASRGDRLTDLQAEVQRKSRAITFGRAAQRQLDQYNQRSLPKDRHLAKSLYQSWLLDRVKQAEFAGFAVNPSQDKMHGDLYLRHGFTISGYGEFPQLVNFLYEFYNVDYLHRIRYLNVSPRGDSNLLDIHINVEALSMKDAENQQLEPRASERLAYKDVKSYVEAIAHRNFFAAANKPPALSGPQTQRGNPNRLVTFKVGGNDPDGDDLTYNLGDNSIDGARIDSESGDFSWTPSELGEFEFEVCATDNGLPPKSVTKTFKVSVVQAPPEKAGFDPATMAVVSGITEESGRREVWVTIRTEGKVLRLKEGDRLAVGTLQGVVKQIRPKEAEFSTDDGRVVIVGLGKSLVPDAASPISGI